MTITLYGIKNCDTVKKARSWLTQQNIDHHFHDFRTDGLSKGQVTGWINDLGLEALVNKRSTTWKELDDTVKISLDTKSAVNIILEHPTLIKRPLLETGKKAYVGFSVPEYQKIFV